MTMRQKQGFVGVSILMLLAAAVLVGNTLYHLPCERPAVRITLVAKGMSFVTLDDPLTPNPALRLPANRTVEIELRNEDSASLHNLVISELKLQTQTLGAGQSEVLRFVTPAGGALAYYCELHPIMMRGELLVGETVASRPVRLAAPVGHAGHAH